MKTAIITGTSSGIGEDFARRLLELGWKVYGISRRENKELVSHKNFRQILLDLSKPLDKKLLSSTVGEPHIDLVVNNAGMVIMQDASIWDEKNYQEIFSVHYVRPIELLSMFANKLDQGMVISVLSDCALIGWPKFGLYGASKAALLRHMESFAQENPQINVINLHPSGIDTPLINDVGPEMIAERDELMKTTQVTTVFLQLATRVISLPSGASIVIHNEWEAEEMQELGKNMYIYNVDTEVLKQL